MKSLALIKSLQSTTKRNEKEQFIMQAFMEGDREFFIAAKLCFDPLVSFGVKKVALIVDGDETGTFSFSGFLSLAGKLQRRELTGHAALAAIEEAAFACDTQTWNLFYRQVLLKDLKAGIDRSTINKILTKLAPTQDDAAAYLIPVFGVQLAKDGADESNVKHLKGIKMLDMKLDGMRFATILDKETNTVTQWTRSGQENTNFPQLTKALATLLPSLPCSIVLDGEVVSRTFQELMTQARRKTNADTSDAKLALFDIIPLDAFRAGSYDLPQHQRHQMLCELETSGALKSATGGAVYVVPKIVVDLDTPEGQATMREQKALAAELDENDRPRFEGIMVKDPDAGYVGKRSIAWLKIKPSITVDLEIVDLQEGTNKYVGKLGAIICKGEDLGREIVVNVGSGFTDEERADYWANPELILGQIVEIEADAVTKSRDKETYGLRFPTLKRFRSASRTPGEKD